MLLVLGLTGHCLKAPLEEKSYLFGLFVSLGFLEGFGFVPLQNSENGSCTEDSECNQLCSKTGAW